MEVDTSMCKHTILFKVIIPGRNKPLSCSSFGEHKKYQYTLKGDKKVYAQQNHHLNNIYSRISLSSWKEP